MTACCTRKLQRLERLARRAPRQHRTQSPARHAPRRQPRRPRAPRGRLDRLSDRWRPLRDRESLATFRTEQHTPHEWRLHHEDVGHTLILGATGSGNSVLLATQSSHDVVDADLLRTIVESCPTKVFLANPDLDAERAKSLFHLNDVETKRITTLQPRRQFVLKRPDVSKVLELTVDPRAYWIYTNAPLDNDRLQHTLEGGSLDEGLTTRQSAPLRGPSRTAARDGTRNN